MLGVDVLCVHIGTCWSWLSVKSFIHI